MPYTAPKEVRTGVSTRAIPTTEAIGDSLAVAATAAAPAAAAAIATLTTPAAGTYRVQVKAGLGLGGVPAAAETLNAELRAGTTVITKLPMVAVQNTMVDCGEFILTLDGATDLSVNAVAAATISTVYMAELVATRIR